MIVVIVIVADGVYSSEEAYGPFTSTEEAENFLTACRYWQETWGWVGQGCRAHAYVRTLQKFSPPVG